MRRKFLNCLYKPFEVHYDKNRVQLRAMDLWSKNDKPKRFSEVVMVESGTATLEYLSFGCDSNSGVELIFCLLNLHKGVNPKWLNFIREEEMIAEWNEATGYSVNVRDGKIYFDPISEVDLDALGNLNACGSYDLFAPDLSSAKPFCFVLDAENKRILVDSEGFELDANCSRTSKRLFIPEELMEFASTRWFINAPSLSRDPTQAIHDWINSVLAVNFPLDRDLRYHENPPELLPEWHISGSGKKRKLVNSDGVFIELQANQPSAKILALVEWLQEGVNRGLLDDASPCEDREG